MEDNVTTEEDTQRNFQSAKQQSIDSMILSRPPLPKGTKKKAAFNTSNNILV